MLTNSHVLANYNDDQATRTYKIVRIEKTWRRLRSKQFIQV